VGDETGDVQKVAVLYQVTVARVGRAQYKAARSAAHRGRLLGTTSTVLAAAVGTSIFASLGTSPSPTGKILTGLASTLAAVLVALQTFLGYEGRAADHQAAGSAYGKLRRKFDHFFLSIGHSGNRHESLSALSRLRGRMDELGEASPLTPRRAYDSAKKEVVEGQGVLASRITGSAEA
jgi:hypothetical protein